MIQFVGENHVAFADQRRDRRQVGVKAALEGNRRLDALECRQPPFQFQVQIHRPGNGAHGSGADPVLVHRAFGGVDQPGIVGEAEIIIRRQVEHPLAVHDKPRALRTATVRIWVNSP